ncbi:hypothetical protein [Sphingopyxis sp.]|uniref:hypothetical protein n=1 Tax=Sphingopyxis sp. TaxID=1908224 RepID=UPI0025D3F960|nr:hypothetical protein [Sphingopyxis sp.]MBK6413238.1 hypothetical protein [Sphingopyxis sp.]
MTVSNGAMSITTSRFCGDRQLLKVARESGIGDGFTVPRHLPGEAPEAVPFSRRSCNARIPLEMPTPPRSAGAVALRAAARRLIGTGSCVRGGRR